MRTCHDTERRRRGGHWVLSGAAAAWVMLAGIAPGLPAVGQGVQARTSPATASERKTDSDRVWLRQGDPLDGTLLNDRFSLRTPYGTVPVSATQVDTIRLAEGPTQIDTLLTIAGDRLSGFLDDSEFRFRPRSGPPLNLRSERIRQVSYRTNSNSIVARDGGQRLLMRNGDALSGLVLGGPFRVATPHVDLAVKLDDVQSIGFDDGQPILARIRLKNGERFEGVWPDQELEIQLSLGATLRVYPTRIQVIDCQPGVGSSDPVAGSPAPTDVAVPPGWKGAAPAGMVWIPPGAYLMGSPVEEADRGLDEGPPTRVTLTRGFWMGRCEVTQTEYQVVMETNPSLFVGDPRRPVERVSWREAIEYCDRLNRSERAAGRLPEDYAYRLPTEAEWEYACRAGTTARFSYGNDPDGYLLGSYAWFNGNSDSETHPVATREPNPWGLYDMHGNVLELCLDGATGTLPGGEVTDPRTPGDGLLRVARGGSWLYGPKSCRSANRDSYGESTRSSDVGFRVVLVPFSSVP